MKENQEKVQKGIKTKKREEQEEEDNEGTRQLEIQAEELDQQSRCLAPKFLQGDLKTWMHFKNKKRLYDSKSFKK